MDDTFCWVSVDGGGGGPVGLVHSGWFLSFSGAIIHSVHSINSVRFSCSFILHSFPLIPPFVDCLLLHSDDGTFTTHSFWWTILIYSFSHLTTTFHFLPFEVYIYSAMIQVTILSHSLHCAISSSWLTHIAVGRVDTYTHCSILLETLTSVFDTIVIWFRLRCCSGDCSWKVRLTILVDLSFFIRLLHSRWHSLPFNVHYFDAVLFIHSSVDGTISMFDTGHVESEPVTSHSHTNRCWTFHCDRPTISDHCDHSGYSLYGGDFSPLVWSFDLFCIILSGYITFMHSTFCLVDDEHSDT